MSPSPLLNMGGLGGPSAPSPRRLSRLFWSLCAVRILWGGCSQLDPEPQGHFSPCSGRSRPLPAYGGRPRSRGGLSPSSIPSSVGFGGHHSGDASISVVSPPSSNSPTHSEIFWEGDLIPLMPYKVQARILCSGGAAHLSPLRQFTTFPLLLGAPLLPPPRLW